MEKNPRMFTRRELERIMDEHHDMDPIIMNVLLFVTRSGDGYSLGTINDQMKKIRSLSVQPIQPKTTLDEVFDDLLSVSQDINNLRVDVNAMLARIRPKK